jgi:hypothetical protein
MVHPDGLADLDYLFVGHVGLVVGDILAYGALEHPGILQHHAEQLARTSRARERLQRHAVH